MIKLKARVYSNGNISEYIRGVVENDCRPFPPQDDKCECGGKLVAEVSDEVIDYTIGDDRREVVVKDFPVAKCEDCGNEYQDFVLSAEVEEAVSNIIEGRLNCKDKKLRYQLPDEIKFIDLLSPNFH